MSPEMFQVFVAVFSVWGAAVAVKAVDRLRTGEPYVFALWDGGAIRMGKRINKMGIQIKVVVGAAMCLCCVAMLARILPVTTAAGVLVFVGVLSVVSDFVCADKS